MLAAKIDKPLNRIFNFRTAWETPERARLLSNENSFVDENVRTFGGIDHNYTN